MNEKISVYPALEKAFKNDPKSFQLLLEANPPKRLKSLDAVLANNPWFSHFLQEFVKAARERLAKNDGGE